LSSIGTKKDAGFFVCLPGQALASLQAFGLQLSRKRDLQIKPGD